MFGFCAIFLFFLLECFCEIQANTEIFVPMRLTSASFNATLSTKGQVKQTCLCLGTAADMSNTYSTSSFIRTAANVQCCAQRSTWRMMPSFSIEHSCMTNNELRTQCKQMHLCCPPLVLTPSPKPVTLALSTPTSSKRDLM